MPCHCQRYCATEQLRQTLAELLSTGACPCLVLAERTGAWSRKIDYLSRCLFPVVLLIALSTAFALCSQKARELGVKGGEFEPFSALTVTVPGAAAAWEDTVKMYGKLDLKQV